MADRNVKRSMSLSEVKSHEAASKRGTGLLGILSDLDWASSLELEEQRPLDASKVTTSQKMHTFNQGIGSGFTVHMILIIMNLIIFYVFQWAFKIHNKIIQDIVWMALSCISLYFKIGFPIWLLQEYYIFPNGVTYTMLSWFLNGYAIGLFIPESLYYVLLLMSALTYNVLNKAWSKQNYTWWERISHFIQLHFSMFVSWEFLIVELFMLALSFAPLWILKKWKKTHKTESYPWVPLDFIQQDEE